MQLRYILSTLLILGANFVLAQGDSLASKTGAIKRTGWVSPGTHIITVSNAAQKQYNRANELYRLKKYEDACEVMKQAINLEPTYTNAYSDLGEWYYKLRKYGEAVSVFRSASGNCYNGQRDFAKPLAKSLLANHQPGEALAVLNTNAPANDKTGEWKHMKDQCTFMTQALGRPQHDTVANMGPRVNTEYPELYPYITADTQTLYFTRRVKGIDEDFFSTKADSCGGWFTPVNLGETINTPDHEYAQAFSVDGHYMFFTKCENRSENGWDKGGCDLYMSFRKSSADEWSVPQNFGATINSPGYEGMACISADNRELYFVSNRDGGYGGRDIWVTKFVEGLWQAPRNLGPEINTKGDETSPYLHLDNQTLYFASTGLVGMGGSDLFCARKLNDTAWGKPKNMGYPINTTADELSMTITEDGKRAYFSSDRGKLEGDYDLFEVTMPKELSPVAVHKIKGYVYDSFSKEKLNYTAIFIDDAKTGDQLYHFNANRGDASYMITLPAEQEYYYRADRPGYMEQKAPLVFTAEKDMNFNIALLPDGYVEPIADSSIIVIHFPSNAKELTQEDKTLIYLAMEPWLTDQAITLTINGYTDVKGNPLLNEELSFERARLVSAEIVGLGVDPERIEVKGWGEANPIGDNDTEEGQARNRRVEVILRR
jgi:outer membrane protein OmpA-like peptidoglycan-associated protein